MSETDEHGIMQRRGFVAGSMGAIFGSAALLATPTGPCLNQARSSLEQANIDLMMSFWSEWGAANLDIDAVVEKYMAPDARVRWTEDSPVLFSSASAASAIKGMMPPGSRIVIHVNNIFAHGPMVASSRTDIIEMPGQPRINVDAAGVSFLLNGKIVEYSDYVVN